MIDGFKHLPAYLDPAAQAALLAEVRAVIAAAPLYTPAMPRSGRPMSVRMTNCGRLGWMTDKARGYRYEALHPTTGQAWPPLPASLLALWRDVVDYPAEPEACLINLYAPSARMGSHVDADEADRAAPVVSVSLGDSAVFHVGGASRIDPKTRLLLASGDVVVLAGPSRSAYHGIDRIVAGSSGLMPEGGRINLTLRRVTVPT